MDIPAVPVSDVFRRVVVRVHLVSTVLTRELLVVAVVLVGEPAVRATLTRVRRFENRTAQ
jgi:hypothetical protein